VRSIRQTGPETDRQWIIELDDQTCSRIPLSWAIPDDQSTPPEPNFSPADLWADVTGLLKLAKMVRNLQANKSTEVTCDEATTGNPTGNACNPDAAKRGIPCWEKLSSETRQAIMIALTTMMVKRLPGRDKERDDE
jgi:hypothetical protein